MPNQWNNTPKAHRSGRLRLTFREFISRVYNNADDEGKRALTRLVQRCAPETLEAQLYQVARSAWLQQFPSFLKKIAENVGRDARKKHKRALWSQMIGATEQELGRFLRNLASLAKQIEELNQNKILNPVLGIPQGSERLFPYSIFRNLPSILRSYATCLETQVRHVRRVFRQRQASNPLRAELVMLLATTRQAASDVPYADLSRALNAAFKTLAGTSTSVPRMFSPEALRQIWRRYGDRYQKQLNKRG